MTNDKVAKLLCVKKRERNEVKTLVVVPKIILAVMQKAFLSLLTVHMKKVRAVRQSQLKPAEIRPILLAIPQVYLTIPNRLPGRGSSAANPSAAPIRRTRPTTHVF